LKNGLLEPITLQGTLHLGSHWLLKWGTKEWLLLFREADAISRKDRMRLGELRRLAKCFPEHKTARAIRFLMAPLSRKRNVLLADFGVVDDRQIGGT
jgi:hypothetical protein